MASIEGIVKKFTVIKDAERKNAIRSSFKICNVSYMKNMEQIYSQVAARRPLLK